MGLTRVFIGSNCHKLNSSLLWVMGMLRVYLRSTSGVTLVYLCSILGLPSVKLWSTLGLPQVYLRFNFGLPGFYLRSTSGATLVYLRSTRRELWVYFEPGADAHFAFSFVPLTRDLNAKKPTNVLLVQILYTCPFYSSDKISEYMNELSE